MIWTGDELTWSAAREYNARERIPHSWVCSRPYYLKHIFRTGAVALAIFKMDVIGAFMTRDMGSVDTKWHLLSLRESLFSWTNQEVFKGRQWVKGEMEDWDGFGSLQQKESAEMSLSVPIASCVRGAPAPALKMKWLTMRKAVVSKMKPVTIM